MEVDSEYIYVDLLDTAGEVCLKVCTKTVSRKLSRKTVWKASARSVFTKNAPA